MAAVNAILAWAAQNGTEVLGVADELVRLHCAATPVSPRELGRRSDLLVSLGGDGTMLRAMRLADGQRAPVLGVNLGKLGFLAEVDVPDLAGALTAIDAKDFVLEPRLAVDAIIGDQVSTAFNDVAVVRFPGQASASVAVRVAGHPFATPTGSTAYSFSAGGPIVSPAVEALVVTPAAPHSAYNRGLVLSVTDSLVLEILPGSGRLAVEVDGQVTAHVTPGDSIELRPRPGAARVVRLGRTTFYERARRKLRLTDSAEIFPGELTDPHEPHPLTGAGAGTLGDPHVVADDRRDMTGSHDLPDLRDPDLRDPDLRDAAARPDHAAGSERAATERS
jgi:NAD+ kinase